VVYGWSRSAIYVSGDLAWPIDDATFDRIARGGSRSGPACAPAARPTGLLRQRPPGHLRPRLPAHPPIGHLINLAELSTLVGLLYALLLAGGRLFRAPASGGPPRAAGCGARSGRASTGSCLAFVAASVIPVVTLALVTRVYIAEQLRRDVERRPRTPRPSPGR